MHWTESQASRVRNELGLKSFATIADADHLLDYCKKRGVDVREDRDADCLGEICKFRGRWLLKLSARLEPSLRADVAFHEIAHRYTTCSMTAVCSPHFHWWWRARDEHNAELWSAHFRIPTDPLLALLRKAPAWEDLLGECGAPEGLLALKLHTLNSPLHRDRTMAEPAPNPDRLPLLASATLKIQIVPENEWQWRVEVVKPSTGERWSGKRAQDPARLSHSHEELRWDLLAWTEHRFWVRWNERLEPLLPKTQRPRWSNPKVA